MSFTKKNHCQALFTFFVYFLFNTVLFLNVVNFKFKQLKNKNQGTTLLRYMIDLQKFNPDWDFATKHGKACKPGRKVTTSIENFNSQENVCQCCLNIIYKEQESIFDHPKQLNFLGTGFPVFYLFVKYCIVLVLLMIVSYNAISLYRDIAYNEEPCSEQSPTYHRLLLSGSFHCTSWMVKFATTQKKVDGEQTIIRIFSFLIHICMLIYMRNQIEKTISYFDQRTCTMSDYAIKIKQIPQQKGIQIKLKKFFQNAFNRKFIIKQTTLIPAYKQLEADMKKKKQLQKEYFKQYYSKNQDTQIISTTHAKLTEIQSQINRQLINYKNQADADELWSSKVILVFQTENQKNKILQQSRAFDKQKYQEYFDGDCSKMKIVQAPQPRQIIWDHINYPTHKRYLRKILGWALSVVFVAIFTIVFYFILREKAMFLAEAKDQHKSVAIFIVYLLIVVVILFNKFVMGTVLHKFTHLQMCDTKLKEQASFSFKYALGMFFTTALMTLAVEAISFDNYYSHLYGVIEEQTVFFFMNAVFVPFIWLVNPFQLFVLVRRKLMFGKENITQRKANKIMEDFSYDMGKRYAQVLETMWFTFLYLTLIPMGAMLTFIGLILYYWVDKFNLLKRSSLKEQVSGKLGFAALKQLDLTLLFRSIGQIVFDSQIRNGVQAVSIVFISISVIYLILPIDKIIWFLNHQKFQVEEKTYSQVKLNFKDTYHTLHPIYRQIYPQKVKQRLQKSMKVINSARLVNDSQTRINVD